METYYDKLHWLYPFPSKTWKDDDGDEREIEVVQSMTESGDAFLAFENTTDHDLQIHARSGAQVIAPISGLVTQLGKNEDDDDLVDVQIVTQLTGDGTRIINELRGVAKLNPLIKPGYQVKQGEWVGFAHYNGPGLTEGLLSYSETPDWYVWVHLPGEKAGKGLWVWGDDKKLHPRGIDWQSENPDELEFLPPDEADLAGPRPQGPRVSPAMIAHDAAVQKKAPSGKKGGLGPLILAAGAAWLLLGKNK